MVLFEYWKCPLCPVTNLWIDKHCIIHGCLGKRPVRPTEVSDDC